MTDQGRSLGNAKLLTLTNKNPLLYAFPSVYLNDHYMIEIVSLSRLIFFVPLDGDLRTSFYTPFPVFT
jgi:hypothetical protein